MKGILDHNRPRADWRKMLMERDEDTLIAQAVQGDEQSLTDLLELVGPAVRAWISGRISRQFRSLLSEDDVMQQAYVDAFLGVKRFVPRGKGSFQTWVSTLAERNLKDAIRMLEAVKRGGNRQRIDHWDEDRSVAALCELIGATRTTPSGHAARHEAQVILRHAIGQLPELYQRVVRLYDLEGRAVTEVATALNRSQGAVFMLRARAHDRLREIMGTASDYLSTSA